MCRINVMLHSYSLYPEMNDLLWQNIAFLLLTKNMENSVRNCMHGNIILQTVRNVSVFEYRLIACWTGKLSAKTRVDDLMLSAELKVRVPLFSHILVFGTSQLSQNSHVIHFLCSLSVTQYSMHNASSDDSKLTCKKDLSTIIWLHYH